MILTRLDKILQALRSVRLTQSLLFYRVLACAEHRHVLARDIRTAVDIGANRGQFALAVRRWAPTAKVISFEPLPGPATVFSKVFSGDRNVLLHRAAIGPCTERRIMHVSARDDSSSLLPISKIQTDMFPGTGEVSTAEVVVGPLADFVKREDILSPALLKLDVQGFEYQALVGCDSMLENFDLVYCECSFVEFYSGQVLAWEVIQWLAIRGFNIDGVYNTSYDPAGQAIQADFLFRRPAIGSNRDK